MHVDARSSQACNCLAVRQAARHVTQFYDRFLAPSGLRTTQFSILTKLRRQAPRSEWPFRKKMAAEGEDGVPDMFDELRGMLPVRYQNAQNDGQRRKIEWMSDYVNDTIAEQNLPAEWKVVLPSVAADSRPRWPPRRRARIPKFQISNSLGGLGTAYCVRTVRFARPGGRFPYDLGGSI